MQQRVLKYLRKYSIYINKGHNTHTHGITGKQTKTCKNETYTQHSSYTEELLYTNDTYTDKKILKNDTFPENNRLR